jgi:hypothetical protein
LNWKGKKEFFYSYVDSWNAHWHSKNEKFESLLLGNPNLKFLSRQTFFVWDDNHKLQAWLLYIQHVHNEYPKWHYLVDFIVLDTSHGLVELFTTMKYLNK